MSVKVNLATGTQILPNAHDVLMMLKSPPAGSKLSYESPIIRARSRKTSNGAASEFCLLSGNCSDMYTNEFFYFEFLPNSLCFRVGSGRSNGHNYMNCMFSSSDSGKLTMSTNVTEASTNFYLLNSSTGKFLSWTV